MFPQFVLGQTVYMIDRITPLFGIVIFIITLYSLIKYEGLRLRDIVSSIPGIIITTLLMGTYTNFVLQSGYIVPHSWEQVQSLFSISVNTLDFIGISVGLLIATLVALKNIKYKARPHWSYVLILSYLIVLAVMGVGYVLGDSVIGKLNEGFFSVGSFIAQSRIGQLGGSVYPIGLLISSWSVMCIACMIIARHYIGYRSGYWSISLLMIGYLIILHYQNYPRHLIVNIGFTQLDLRSYCCIAIACISLYLGYSMRGVHRLVRPVHEDSVGKTR